MTLPPWEETLRLAQSLDAVVAKEAQECAGSQVRPGQQLPLFVLGGAAASSVDVLHTAVGTAADAARASVASANSDLTPDGRMWRLLLPTWGYEALWNNKLIYNTRIESAANSMWVTSFATGRAVVCAQEFFEPHERETWRNPVTGRVGKRSYSFTNPDGKALLLGAICQGGRASIVTTEPNASVAPVHRRMPLVLRFEELDIWLGEKWQTLADRSGVVLEVAPEHDGHQAVGSGPGSSNSATEQLTLF